jgi:hypothetical protein
MGSVSFHVAIENVRKSRDELQRELDNDYNNVGDAGARAINAMTVLLDILDEGDFYE